MLGPVAEKHCVQISMNLSIEVCPYASWFKNHGIVDLVAVAPGNSSVCSIRYSTPRLLGLHTPYGNPWHKRL
jgi:hypothetical protein